MAAAPIPQEELAAHPVDQALAWAHPLVQEWFTAKFGTATEPQVAGWPAILRGEATLISAPTGSGKTLAAFLVCIDGLLRAALEGRLHAHTHVIYISPLKALSNDVQKNLDGPLREIQQLAMQRGYLCPEIRTAVRTGDTPTKERAAMLRHPPHILVTTPESLYLLLTAGKSRQNLTRVSTVIVDEIHAIADDKRGSHLALSLERLEALVRGENRLSPGAMLTGLSQGPQRIGLSATQNPIELVANFLVGSAEGRAPATIVQVGQRRVLDLAIEVPSDELGSITSIAMWTEIFDKLAGFANQHRSTLVFVNTRKLVEKISFELTQRLGEDAVAAHHGSLSRALRLDAEQRLKSGEIRILVATASLELGIDIGTVDLVCQIATTRAVAVAMQRVGRAGHWRGAIPKGRFFATTRDDLMEQAALLRKMVAGELDRLEIPETPVDVLMQQIVAACGAESWEEDALYDVLRRAWPYRTLTRAHFDELVGLLHNGIESSRGRYGAYLLRDRVQGQLHARRGARMTAIANGGAIPDTSLYAVMLQPENVQIATLDEHFAVDSSPGDVVLLGNTSWRIQRVDPQGKVLVEDAHGAPPSIPFWEGEAPQRTAVLSDGVADLRAEIDVRTQGVKPSEISATHETVAACITWLKENCFVADSAAMQMVTYIVSGRAALGAVPTKTTIIAERFFDEGGGQQLILHAPFGGRLNKAWGLALRKRFCRGFNFELQAAATDNGINISLAEQHSFPLADVFQFLSTQTARDLLEQASIPSPLFKNRWRWAAGRSLQLLRMQKGKRVAPQIQRSRSDDLLASVFPHASACPETMVGDIEIPDHPLVREVMRDTLSEAMDIDGLNEVLAGIASGVITCVAVDTPVPSVFAHELVNAMPYAFLDEAGAEERRARAVTLRRALPDSVSDGAGRLDQAAIDTVREQLWPDIRDEHEMHDLLLQVVALPLAYLATERAVAQRSTRHWPAFLERLQQQGRAYLLIFDNAEAYVAAERLAEAHLLWPDTVMPDDVSVQAEVKEFVLNGTESRPAQTFSPRDSATTSLVQGWLQLLGPTTAEALGTLVHLHPRSLHQSLLAMEMQGLAMRGVIERGRPADDAPFDIEWCERRILQRIHRLTLAGLRKAVEPVTPAVFMRWLLDWQHLAPGTQLAGEEGVLAAIEQLEGFEAPAVEWERTLLPARVAGYQPQWLDNLCLAGVVGWGRISPHPAWLAEEGSAPRRVIPTSAAPVTFYLRESADWLPDTLAAKCVDESVLAQSLSNDAQQIRGLLRDRGAAFTADLQRASGLTKLAVTTALWELATAGLASADGWDQMRAVMDPRRKSAAVAQTPAVSLRKRAAARTTAGRWSLLCDESNSEAPVAASSQADSKAAAAQAAIARAKRNDASLEAQARVLLCRYGVIFRDLLQRESNAPKWRDLAPMLRRLEARGEVRGGRFVSGPFGEQFAVPEAADALRKLRRENAGRVDEAPIAVAGADPLNLAGILVAGERVPAIPGREVQFLNGSVVGEDADEVIVIKPKRSRSIADMLRADAATPRVVNDRVTASPGLFS
ncbi:MAG TPA: DEAD/DEAH box helicase [Acidobacteriaceae bacterium]|jgi:ATP-dependent Lhr-like helicase